MDVDEIIKLKLECFLEEFKKCDEEEKKRLLEYVIRDVEEKYERLIK